MAGDKKLFCFGYGYSCEYLCRALAEEDSWHLAGTTRDREKKSWMKEQGIKTFIFDATTPLEDPRRFLRDVTHLLISTPPNDSGDPAFVTHGEDIRNLPNLQWIGYLSSTGVYGDRDGDLVDEHAELRPNNKRGSRRVKAESQWLSLFHEDNLPVHIFRLAGIYGPGRSALDSVRAGMARRIDKPGHAFNRIHVEDIARILKASMNNPAPGNIYNLADDYASPSHELIAYACTLLGLDVPPLIPFDQADLAPIARSFYQDNKRIDNNKIKTALGMTLRYPDYKTGLQACLEAENKQASDPLQPATAEHALQE